MNDHRNIIIWPYNTVKIMHVLNYADGNVDWQSIWHLILFDPVLARTVASLTDQPMAMNIRVSSKIQGHIGLSSIPRMFARAWDHAGVRPCRPQGNAGRFLMWCPMKHKYRQKWSYHSNFNSRLYHWRLYRIYHRIITFFYRR